MPGIAKDKSRLAVPLACVKSTEANPVQGPASRGLQQVRA